MGKNIKLRTATIDDVSRIFEIEELCFPPEEAATKEKYQWRIGNFASHTIVCELDDKIISVVCALPYGKRLIEDDIFEMDTLPSGDTSAILSVMTDPAFKCQGFAETTLNYAIENEKSLGMKTMSLTCKNHLLHYYEKFGFKKVGVSASVHGGATWYDMVLDFQ